MPHIKVKPFDTTKFDKLDFVSFRGVDSSGEELVVVEKDSNILLLNVIKRDNEYLIKQSRVQKHEDILFVKETLNAFVKLLGLEVLHSNTNIKPYKPKIAHRYLKKIEDFYEFQTDFKKVALEIGFGSGKHLLHQAVKNPDTLHIGIEIHTPSINQVLKQITLNGYQNIFIINYDGRLLLEMLQSNFLDTIYVHFPVPWDKKPHRRVISKKFLDEAMRVLKVGGELELRTDSENYYEYSNELFKNCKNSKMSVVKNQDLDIVSKYEARWKRMEKNIYTLSLISLENSEIKDYNIDFGFYNLGIKGKIPHQSLIKDDYFVHFGSIYKDNNEKVAIECSFGSFNMNEKRIIYIDSHKQDYLPMQPAKSIINFKAHKLIEEVLNGECN